MAEHAKFTVATGVQVSFCDPQSPWQRGSNENTNRLLRQYLPKGAPIGELSQQQLNAIARKLNERPRKTLNFETPADRLAVALTATAVALMPRGRLIMLLVVKVPWQHQQYCVGLGARILGFC